MNLGASPNIPPHSPVGGTLGIQRRGLQGFHPPPGNHDVLKLPALGMAFLGSGLDLRWGQCPGLGVRPGVWNWLFFNLLCDLV